MTALLGLLPALALLPVSGWTRATGALSFATLRTGAETPGYSPVVVVGLLAVAGIVVLRAMRRSGQQQREPAWSGGFAAPPPWLPFGDPATQYGPASFVEPIQRVLVPPLPIATLRRHLVHCRDAVLWAVSVMVAP
jgi:hypothetical protein